MNTMMINRKEKANKRGKLGITRGQALIFILAFACFFYLLGGFVFASETKTEQQTYKLVTVHPGDSLWKLAVRYHEKAGMDVQEMIDELIEINGLQGAIIYPGQNMKIPLQQ